MLLTVASCGSNYPKETTEFVVTGIQSANFDTMLAYRIAKINNKLNTKIDYTWIVDTYGKYKVGDTLVLKLK